MTVYLLLHRASCWFGAFAGFQAGQHAHTDAPDYDLCLSNTRVTSPSDLDPAFKAANTCTLRTTITHNNRYFTTVCTTRQLQQPGSCTQ